MADIRCPRDEAVIPMENCMKCEYVRKPDDVSNIWCRYLIANQEPATGSNTSKETLESPEGIRNIYALINYKKKQAETYYKTGKPRIAEKIEREIAKLRKECKPHEISDKTFNQEEKTVL